MSNVTKGVIEEVFNNEVPTKFGNKPKVVLTVNGERFSSFVTNKNKAMIDAVKEGDVVELTYEVNGEYKNLVSVAKMQEQPVAKATVAQTTTATAIPAPAIPVPTEVQGLRTKQEDKDFRIGFNGNLKVAVEIIGLALANEALSLPTKKADKLDVLVEATIKVAQTLTQRSYEAYKDSSIKQETKEADTGPVTSGLKE